MLVRFICYKCTKFSKGPPKMMVMMKVTNIYKHEKMILVLKNHFLILLREKSPTNFQNDSTFSKLCKVSMEIQVELLHD